MLVLFYVLFPIILKEQIQYAIYMHFWFKKRSMGILPTTSSVSAQYVPIMIEILKSKWAGNSIL